MKDFEIAIALQSPLWLKALPGLRAFAKKAAVAALKAESRSGAIALLFSDDAAIQILNRDFRGFDKPTNVLAFPAAELDPGPHAIVPLGDVALAAETVIREATESDKPLKHHVGHLVVHGVLHLLGFDHEKDADAKVMESEETKILAGLGIPDPYTLTA